jgi:hypothetical protein
MKKLFITNLHNITVFFLMVIFAATLHAQDEVERQKSPNLINWNETGIHLRTEFDGVYAYSNSQLIDNGKSIAFLSANENEIIIYEMSNLSNPKEKIAFEEWAEDFCIEGDNLYLLHQNEIGIWSYKTHKKMQTLSFQRPESTPFSVHALRLIDGKPYILTDAEKTYSVTSKGLTLVDDNNWWVENAKVRTEKRGLTQFQLFADFGNTTINRNYQVKDLGLSNDLGTVIVAGVSASYIYLDIEMTDEDAATDIERFIVALDKQGKMVNKFSIPTIYHAYAKNRFLSTEKGLIYLLEGKEGIYLCELSEKGLQMPILNESHYDYNEHLKYIDEPNDSNGAKILQGNNCVTRTEIWENAYKYLNMSWTSTSANIGSSGTYFQTPQVSPWTTTGSKTSVPYEWGGFTYWNNWKSLAAAGKLCGNQNTTCITNGWCGESSDNIAIGVDCSGFVSRCWETAIKYGTTTLPTISSSLGGASTTSGFNSLLVGDIINTTGHVRLSLSDNPNGTVTVMESSAGNWSVRLGYYSPSQLTSYTSRRYNNITDARLRLAQAITLSTTNVYQGCPLTVTYKVGNYGTESWTGNVQLSIIQSNGNEVALQTTSGVTLGAGATSQTFSFTSGSITSPLGSSKFIVRVKNNSTACNYGLYYNVGNGSYSNPLTFNIGTGTCSGSTCAAPTGASAYSPTSSSCSFTWNAVSGASSYNLFYLNGSTWTQFGSPVTGTSSNITGLAASTQYCFAAKAVCTNGLTSALSNSSCVTTLSAGTTCNAPTGLYTANAASTSCNLYWNVVSGATYYNLYYLSGSTWTQFGNPVYGTSSSITGLAASTQYCFAVKAVCNGTLSNLSSSVCMNTLSNTAACSAPTGLYTSTITTTSCNLYWNGVSGASYYWLYYWNGSAWQQFGSAVYGTSSGINGLASGGVQYCFAVQAVCGSTSSALSSYVCMNTYITAPPSDNTSALREGIINDIASVNSTKLISQNIENAFAESNLNAIATAQGLNVYPNPNTDGKFSIDFLAEAEGKSILTVTDITGKLIFEKAISYNAGANKLEIALPNLMNGIYFLHVNGHTVKVVKE